MSGEQCGLPVSATALMCADFQEHQIWCFVDTAQLSWYRAVSGMDMIAGRDSSDQLLIETFGTRNWMAISPVTMPIKHD